MRTDLIRELEHHRAMALADRTPQAISPRLLMSWIHHDNMLEGRMFHPGEISEAFKGKDAGCDAYLQPLMKRIREYRDVIEYIWRKSYEGPSAVSLETLKRIHKMLTPSGKDRGGLYRKTSPVHRDYYQRICAPEKIPYHLKKLFEFIEEGCQDAPDPVEFAAQVHHRLMFIYPFRRNPGMTARLFTNLLLLAQGYPPAILSAHARQSYYRALDHAETDEITQIYHDAVSHLLDKSGGLYLIRS
ncbi:Fic family protein [Myxococcota bacterium]|nr:Fic family protein [Myxococcota bacterium]MBU1433115.1 Fic family protein [Myxococcota bacterium]MBU1900048.1 Fic family protein [Myxococcota bacterium]